MKNIFKNLMILSIAGTMLATGCSSKEIDSLNAELASKATEIEALQAEITQLEQDLEDTRVDAFLNEELLKLEKSNVNQLELDLQYYKNREAQAISGTTINNITQRAMKATMQVRNSCAFGSGVIYKEDAQYYYVITNNHVVTACPSPSYSVKDYDGTLTNATLLAHNSEYDLAVLKFVKKDKLVVLPFATVNPEIYTRVFSLGYPAGQVNALTAGEVANYSTIQLSNTDAEESDVKFNVINHSAIIKGGSSGGPLINADCEVVGINYAGSTASEEIDAENFPFTLSDGSAIPIEKVKEFLELNSLA
ncbi:MAG: trypsin-like peptidase domain-containing protein [Bacilli bacterium]